MDRMICTKGLVSFLFTHRTYVWDICKNRLKYPKYILLEVLMQYSCIISHQQSPPERRFRDIEIVITTNFVVVWSVGIKRVDCI